MKFETIDFFVWSVSFSSPNFFLNIFLHSDTVSNIIIILEIEDVFELKPNYCEAATEQYSQKSKFLLTVRHF